MNWALASLFLSLAGGLLAMLVRPLARGIVLATTSLALGGAVGALLAVQRHGEVLLAVGGWPAPLGIRFLLTPLSALLLVFGSALCWLVMLYALRRPRATGGADFWALCSLLQAGLAGLWLSLDLFNLYVLLEWLGLCAVALVALAGPRALRPALDYLLLSLCGSLVYLLGVAVVYGEYGVLDVLVLQASFADSPASRLALCLMSLGLMVKAALWPLHLWLPAAHAGAPSAVSALLSALVVKAPLYLLWLLWTQLAPADLARQGGPAFAVAGRLGVLGAGGRAGGGVPPPPLSLRGLAGPPGAPAARAPPVGPAFAVAGLLALLGGGWSALRTPRLKALVAYSTVAQLGYALLALGLLLRSGQSGLQAALWLFVLAHGLAKVSMFLAAGELQEGFGSRRVAALRGASQRMPLALFAFVLAGASLVGLPPSGGFLAKWLLLQPLFADPALRPWVLAVLLGTLASAGYVFRVVALGFDRAGERPLRVASDRPAQWLALLPALLAWGLALAGQPLLVWLSGVTR